MKWVLLNFKKFHLDLLAIIFFFFSKKKNYYCFTIFGSKIKQLEYSFFIFFWRKTRYKSRLRASEEKKKNKKRVCEQLLKNVLLLYTLHTLQLLPPLSLWSDDDDNTLIITSTTCVMKINLFSFSNTCYIRNTNTISDLTLQFEFIYYSKVGT